MTIVSRLAWVGRVRDALGRSLSTREALCDCCAFLVLSASPEHPKHEPIINLATISLLLSKIWRFPPPRMLGNHDNLAETWVRRFPNFTRRHLYTYLFSICLWQIDKHNENQCALVEISCPFSKLGCPEKVRLRVVIVLWQHTNSHPWETPPSQWVVLESLRGYDGYGNENVTSK